MTSAPPIPPLPWLYPGDDFPAPDQAWKTNAPLPGLLAAGGDLGTDSLLRAYRQGTFPWFSPGDPILWWCPDPRMVLQPSQFRLHRSLRKTIAKFRNNAACEIRVDSAFDRVIRHCAASPREGQTGTWIVPEMQQAYQALHREGHAHSFETWIDGQLAGGLYLVNIGHAVFGESMFALQTDASKIALAALVAFAREHGLPLIDCQQNTRHLASLGAAEIPRDDFLDRVTAVTAKCSPTWEFSPVYWRQILPTSTS